MMYDMCVCGLQEKLFHCSICQKAFAQRRYLMKHATEIHRDVALSLYGEDGERKDLKSIKKAKYIIQQPAVSPETLKMKYSAEIAAPEQASSSGTGEITQAKIATKTQQPPNLDEKPAVDTSDKKYRYVRHCLTDRQTDR